MELVGGARALLGLQPKATERDRIERETNLGAVEEVLAKLGAELGEVRERLSRIADEDVNARNPLGARVTSLQMALIPAARRRVRELRHEMEKRRREEEHAARLKADPLLRDTLCQGGASVWPRCGGLWNLPELWTRKRTRAHELLGRRRTDAGAHRSHSPRLWFVCSLRIGSGVDQRSRITLAA